MGMSARDIFHDEVKNALVKDGWNVTDDPLRLTVGKTDLWVDLGAEPVLAAERPGERIAVEIKSFVGMSPVQDLKEALGQYQIYVDALEQSPTESDRTLFLAVREITYEDVFAEPLGKMMLDNKRLRLIVFDPKSEEITQWIR
jgi:hypothetical protein